MLKKYSWRIFGFGIFLGFQTLPFSIAGKTIFVEIPQSCGRMEWNENSTESESNFLVTSASFQTLIRISQNGQIQPYLADHWEILNPQLIKFRLKPSLQFANGAPLKAESVRLSFQRIKERTDFTKGILSNIQKIEVIDDLHFYVHLKESDPLILQKIAIFLRLYYIPFSLRETLLPGSSKSESLVGTGPWLFLRKEKDHFLFQSVKYGQKLKLEIYCNSDGSAIDSKANKNRGDRVLIENLGGRKHLGSRKKFVLRTFETLAARQTFGVFNLLSDNEALKDLKIRKAINLSINREIFKRLVLKNQGLMRPGLSLANEIGSVKKPIYPFNPEEAKQLVDEWKQKHGQKLLVLRVGLQSQEPETLSFLDQLSFSLSRIGIEMAINPHYSIDKHHRFRQNIDVIFGSDPSPYLHIDFLLRNFYFPKGTFYVGAPLPLRNKITSLRHLKTGDHTASIYFDIDRLLHSQYLGIPGFQLIRMRAYSGPLRDLSQQNSLLDFSLLHTGGVQ